MRGKKSNQVSGKSRVVETSPRHVPRARLEFCQLCRQERSVDYVIAVPCPNERRMLADNMVKKQSLSRQVHRQRRPGAMAEREQDARLQPGQEAIVGTSTTWARNNRWHERSIDSVVPVPCWNERRMLLYNMIKNQS